MQHKLLEIYERLQGPWTILQERDPAIVSGLLLPAKFFILGCPGVIATYKSDDLIGKEIMMFVHVTNNLENAIALKDRLDKRIDPILQKLYRYRETRAIQYNTKYKIHWKIQSIPDWSV